MKRALYFIPTLAVMLTLGGCNTPEGQVAAAGALAGGANGAMVGASVTAGHPAGVALGGVFGAAGGAILASAANKNAAGPAVGAPPPQVAPAPALAANAPPAREFASPAVAADGRPPRQVRPPAYAPPNGPRYSEDREFAGNRGFGPDEYPAGPGGYPPPWRDQPYAGYDRRDAALGYAPGEFDNYSHPPLARRFPPCADFYYNWRGVPICEY